MSDLMKAWADLLILQRDINDRIKEILIKIAEVEHNET